MPRKRSYYDAFADTRVGTAVLRHVYGTGREPPPSYFWRGMAWASQHGAYIADRAFSSLYSHRASSNYDTQTMPRGSRYNNPKYVNTQARHVRGKGVVMGSRLLPRRVRANVRIGQYLPQKITTEVRTELRTPAGQQGVVTAISQRRLPSSTRTGELIRDVNRDSGGTYQYFDQITTMASSTDTTPVPISLTHRRDWTMFTNPAWRDGLAFMNSQFTTGAQSQTGFYPAVLVNGAGQATPTTADGYKLDTDGIGFVPCAYYQSMTPQFLTTSLAANVPRANVSQTSNYYHIMEELSWSFQNNGDTPVAITLYEFILNRDVALNSSLDKGGATTLPAEGGLPCPLELWRMSREIMFEDINAGMEIGGGVSDRVILAAERETPGATVQNMGDAAPVTVTTPTAPLAGSVVLDTDPTNPVTTGASVVSDIDAPGVSPKVAHLLHTWYKVKQHTRRIGPGQNTTITIHVRFNKKIPGAWFHTMYGIKGLTRSFALVTRPDPVVGATVSALGAQVKNSRQSIMAPTDITLRWWKTKQMAKTPQKEHCYRYFRAAQPAFTQLTMRDPNDDDEEIVDALDGA